MKRLQAILIAGALLSAPVSLSAQSIDATAPLTGIGDQATTPEQSTGAVSNLPYRILDQDRMLRGSRLGQQILAGIRAAEGRVAADNQALFDQLAAEERALTEARPDLSTEEFRARADAFDARVEAIRTERAQLSQQLARWSDAEAQRFYDAALPILVDLMNEEGVLALMRPETVILGSDVLDLTGAAIERLDASAVDLGEPSPFPPVAEDAQTPADPTPDPTAAP